MRIDTRYDGEGRRVVEITLTEEGELGLTDTDLRKIAKNQHLLRWHNCSSGIAWAGDKLGREPVYAEVQRDGGHVTVVLPVDA